MSRESIDRRSFLSRAGAVAAGAAVADTTPLAAAAPIIRRSGVARPVVIASANGIRGVAVALDLVQRGGDTLDAIVEGVKIQELDPADTSVGYGGLPNEEGIVQLDASCMHGPTMRAGAVCALEGIRTPSEIARLVLKYTNHILLAGKDAQRFAVSYGYKVEDLMTERSREQWLRWRANRGANDDWLNVTDNEPMGVRQTGTINMNIVSASGDVSSVTTTSGLAWKIPGRVGDSPIIGAGQYTDNTVGAAGSTGRGESNIMVCGGFLTVEHMRRGMHPKDAALETLRRVIAITPPRLLDERGRPTFGLNFYAVNVKGEYGAASLNPSTFAVADDRGARIEDTAVL